MRGGRLHLGARSKVSGRPGAGMATPGRPACAWPACATSGNFESLESIRPKCVNQPDPPAWSWRMAHVRECGIFKNGGQCVGARRTPRYPLERGHLAGRGRWNRSVNFDLVHSSRGPGKVLLPHHCHRMMSL